MFFYKNVSTNKIENRPNKTTTTTTNNFDSSMVWAFRQTKSEKTIPTENKKNNHYH